MKHIGLKLVAVGLGLVSALGLERGNGCSQPAKTPPIIVKTIHKYGGVKQEVHIPQTEGMTIENLKMALVEHFHLSVREQVLIHGCKTLDNDQVISELDSTTSSIITLLPSPQPTNTLWETHLQRPIRVFCKKQQGGHSLAYDGLKDISDVPIIVKTSDHGEATIFQLAGGIHNWGGGRYGLESIYDLKKDLATIFPLQPHEQDLFYAYPVDHGPPSFPPLCDEFGRPIFDDTKTIAELDAILMASMPLDAWGFNGCRVDDISKPWVQRDGESCEFPHCHTCIVLELRKTTRWS